MWWNIPKPRIFSQSKLKRQLHGDVIAEQQCPHLHTCPLYWLYYCLSNNGIIALALCATWRILRKHHWDSLPLSSPGWSSCQSPFFWQGNTLSFTFDNAAAPFLFTLIKKTKKKKLCNLKSSSLKTNKRSIQGDRGSSFMQWHYFVLIYPETKNHYPSVVI